MVHLRATYLSFLCIICLGISLSGCAGDKAPPRSSEKIGMHIDAVMEFIVEYPLSWEKDRRLPYGSSSGEVRWTHPERNGVLLQIKSTTLKAASHDKEAAGMPFAEYPGMTVSKEETIVLPAGEATFLSGQNSLAKISSYQLLTPERVYIINFIKPSHDSEDDQWIINKVTQSFRALSQGAE